MHGPERVFSNASKTPRASNAPDDKPKVTPNTTSLAAVEKDSTSNQTPKTSAGLPSVTDIKGLLQVKTIEVVSGSGESCKVLALIDSACSHSLMSIRLANRMSLKASPLNSLSVASISRKQ